MGTTHTPLRPGRSLSLSLTASCSRFSPARYCTTLSSPRDTPNKVRGSPGFLPIAPMGTPGAMARPDALVLSVQVPSATAQSPERIYRSMVSRLYLLLDLKGTVLLLDRLYSLIISQGFVYKDRPWTSILFKLDSRYTRSKRTTWLPSKKAKTSTSKRRASQWLKTSTAQLAWIPLRIPSPVLLCGCVRLQQPLEACCSAVSMTLSKYISSSTYTPSRRYRCHLRCSGRFGRRPRRQRGHRLPERGHHSIMRRRSTRRSHPSGYHIRQVWPQARHLVFQCSVHNWGGRPSNRL